MIRDYLTPALKARFPKIPFEFGSDGLVATAPIPCREIGPLAISEEGDEVIIFIDRATHGHFGCHDEDFTIEQKERKITEDVLEFLESLFSDRVVVQRIGQGFAGGWKVLEPGQMPKRSWIWQQFLWSRPV